MDLTLNVSGSTYNGLYTFTRYTGVFDSWKNKPCLFKVCLLYPYNQPGHKLYCVGLKCKKCMSISLKNSVSVYDNAFKC